MVQTLKNLPLQTRIILIVLAAALVGFTASKFLMTQSMILLP